MDNEEFILYEKSMKRIDEILCHPELTGDSKTDMIDEVVNDLKAILILMMEDDLG